MTTSAELRGTRCYVAWGSELERAFVSAMLPDKLVADLNKLTARMKKLPTTDPDSFSRADAIRIVLRRGVQELQKDIARAEKK